MQKLYKMYIKTIKNTKSEYILYTKIIQIKTLHDNECAQNVLTVQTCTKFRLKMAWNLKYMFFVHTKHCTNYTKPIQLAN